MDREELNKLKYRELQKLAKRHGVKANLPKSALIEAILSPVIDVNKEEEKAETTLNETFEVKDSFLNSKSPSKTPVGQEKGLVSLFPDEDDLILTPRGTLKPRTYLPPSSKRLTIERTSSGLTIPSFSPRNQDVPITMDEEEPSAETDQKVSSFMTPTASSMAKSRKSSLAMGAMSRNPKDSLRASLVGVPGSVTKRTSLSSSVRRRNSNMKKSARLEEKSSSVSRRKMPNFAKLHEKQFDQMASLGEYLTKKRDRMNAMTPAKSLLPKPVSKAVRRSPRNLGFVPTAKSVKEANFNFGQNSTTITTTSSSNNKPFAFAAVKEDPKILTNITNTKNFDLQASLAKPLGYKPYKGKVGSWNPSTKKEERIAMVKKQSNIKPGTWKKSIIKGVRMNKRAQLLLKLRNSKGTTT